MYINTNCTFLNWSIQFKIICKALFMIQYKAALQEIIFLQIIAET